MCIVRMYVNMYVINSLYCTSKYSMRKNWFLNHDFVWFGDSKIHKTSVMPHGSPSSLTREYRSSRSVVKNTVISMLKKQHEWLYLHLICLRDHSIAGNVVDKHIAHLINKFHSFFIYSSISKSFGYTKYKCGFRS